MTDKAPRMEITTANKCAPDDLVIAVHWSSSIKLTRQQAEVALRHIELAARHRQSINDMVKRIDKEIENESKEN